MTARPVGDGDGQDELRYAIAYAFEEDQGVPLMHGMAVARRLLDGPITAWAEQRARERAAEELEEVLSRGTSQSPLEAFAWAARRHVALRAEVRTA